MEQDYIQAYRLILKVANIQNMPDTLEKGIAMQQWIKEATALVDKVNQPCSYPALNLVQIKSHLPQQNCDDASHLA